MMAKVGRSHSVTGLIGEQAHIQEPQGDPSRVLVWIVLALCGICYFSQSFSAWAWPALDGYPAIERWLDPGFLPGDLYTNTTTRYGVDTWQAVLFGGFQRLSGVPYALTIAALTTLRLLLFPAVIYAFLCGLLGRGPAALLGIGLAVLADFNLPHTLGWQWLWGDGSPAMFAALAATGAWVLVLRRRVWESLLLMAAAAILQPLVAVHGGIVFALVFILDYDAHERWKAITSPANLGAGGVFLFGFLSQYVLLSPPPAERLPDAEYLRILVWERHPTDFLPSRFKPPEVIAFFIAVAGVLVMLARVWRELPRRTLIVGGLGVYAALCVAGWVFVEIRPTRLAADLIPFRTAVFGAPFLLAVISAFAGQVYKRRDLISLGLLILAFGSAGPVAEAFHLPGIAPASLLLLAGAIGPALPNLPTARLQAIWGAPLWLAMSLALASQASIAAYHRGAAMALPTLANQHPVYSWAMAQTSPDAVFLLEQKPSDWTYGLKLSPQRMRLIGRRAVAASMDFPFADRDQRAWLETWTKGLDHGRRDFIETASAAQIAKVCHDLPFDYLVRVHPLEGQAPVAIFAPSHGLPAVQVYRPCPARAAS